VFVHYSEALKPLSELLRDRILLVGAALLVCLIGGEAFTLADDYHINPAWVFFAWNSIFLIPIVGRRFKKPHWGNPRFIAFFGVWMVLTE
jgi:hypothetical protein